MDTTQKIIEKFELYFGDETSLSTQEELDLIQKKYTEVLESEEWEFLIKEATGTTTGEITAPNDFNRLTANQNIFIGNTNEPFSVIPFINRRGYNTSRGYFYFDARQNKFVSTVPLNSTYSFDYIYVPPLLDTVSSNPVFPVRFYDVLYHAMCIDADIINMSDKARSYADVNATMYKNILDQMKTWNKKINAFNTYGI